MTARIIRRAARFACALTVPLLLALFADTAFAAKVTFRYQPVIGGVTSVSVGGSFNGWNATANMLKDDDKDGVWSAEIELPPGRVEYKFVVNGDQWFTDETAAETSPDLVAAAFESATEFEDVRTDPEFVDAVNR